MRLLRWFKRTLWEIRETVELILLIQEATLAGIDNINTALDSISTEVDAVADELVRLVDEIRKAGANQDNLNAAAARAQGLSDRLKAAVETAVAGDPTPADVPPVEVVPGTLAVTGSDTTNAVTFDTGTNLVETDPPVFDEANPDSMNDPVLTDPFA